LNPDIIQHYSGFRKVLGETNLVINPASKVCLVGKSGSGIESFMHAVLGEAHLSSGIFMMNGVVNYISETHQIFVEDTVKANIVLSKKYERSKFLGILSSLNLDLSKYPSGSDTQIMPNGLNFSLTERKQILLARMLYHGGEIFCLENFFEDLGTEIAGRFFT
jgi:ABC-type transport system involved in cytochrome bd biosynthesis fused ATPase/permease subunit